MLTAQAAASVRPTLGIKKTQYITHVNPQRVEYIATGRESMSVYIRLFNCLCFADAFILGDDDDG